MTRDIRPGKRFVLRPRVRTVQTVSRSNRQDDRLIALFRPSERAIEARLSQPGQEFSYLNRMARLGMPESFAIGA